MVALALKIHSRRRCPETRTYDANGNQLTKTSADGVETRTYNGFGQTMSATVKGVQTIYAYRPDGLRYKKMVGTATTIHIWNGASVIADITNGAISTKYLRGAGLATREAGGKREYYMFNAHGDVVRRMDAAGNAVKEYDYDAFGNENKPDAGDANVFRYCGEYFDKETGNVYLRARYYSPGIGRFGTEECPAIAARAKAENAVMYWADETRGKQPRELLGWFFRFPRFLPRLSGSSTSANETVWRRRMPPPNRLQR